MQKKQGRGTSESTWLVMRRCLAIINRLQQGSATKNELLTAVYIAEGNEAYGNQVGRPLNRRFEEDKKRLRTHLDVDIRYDKTAKGYIIEDRERPLINLSDSHLETLATLADTYQPNTPHAPGIHQLIDQLTDWLPPERQKRVKRLSGQQPTPDLRLRDSEEISSDVWKAVLEAWQAKQEIQFDYLSSQHEDGIRRQHHIQPWDLYFSNRGHWHLRGYCLFNDGPNGHWEPRDYINYRVSRIVPESVEILPRKLPGIRPFGKPRSVVFELAPAIARFGVSQRPELIDGLAVMEMDEGWVRVEGKTHDIFQLARNLLYYGRNCRVLGGRELLQEIRKLTSDLAEIYQ